MLCFFNLAGALVDPGIEGIEVASLSDARKLAAQHLAEIIRDDPHAVWGGEEVRVEVTTVDQVLLFTAFALGVDAPSRAGQWER